jgi:hypothetical protein
MVAPTCYSTVGSEVPQRNLLATVVYATVLLGPTGYQTEYVHLTHPISGGGVHASPPIGDPSMPSTAGVSCAQPSVRMPQEQLASH